MTTARSLGICAATAVAAFAWAGPVSGTAGPRGPDLELGRYLATECMTCHRAATATSTIPNIFGMAEMTFTEVIKAYRAGKLPNPVMRTVAGRLADDEIEALAAFFARATP